MLDSALSAILPISHIQRHAGGYRYEKEKEFQIFDSDGEPNREKGFGRLAQTILGLEQFDEFDEPSRSEIPIFGPIVDAVNLFRDRDKFAPFSKGNPNRYSVFNLISN